MSLNKGAKGDSIMIAIPAGGCQSGGQMVGTVATPGLCIQVGNDVIGIPEGSYAAATAGNVTLHLRGIFGNMTLKTGDAPAIGDKLYWDNTDGYLTVTSGGNVWAGWAMSVPVVGTITTVALKLKG